MDVSIPLIFLVLFVVALLSLFLVYKLGIKEKSYEEALAEQRQQTNALLGVKPKSKEKKSKKAAKKSKEKTAIHEDAESVESEKDQQSESSSHSTKLHVEFKEQPEEVPITEEIVPIKELVKTKKSKKVRPILVKKEQLKLENVKLDVVETPIINHFEENPPKDEFELLRSNSKDDLFKPQLETPKEKPMKEKKQDPPAASNKNNKKASKQTAPPPQVQATVTESSNTTPPVEEKHIDEKIIETAPVTLQSNGLIVSNSGKEKKKKKSEFNVRQQLTAERDGLINSVRTADLSKTDVQILIDLLLNKQLEAPDKLDEWTEGKSDPVQKLKKQLAEKEKLLVEEQEALVGAQARLREVRVEQQNEKAQFQQRIRSLEEALQSKQVEINSTAAHQQAATQKIQHVQAELNNEIARNRKMAEEISVLQIQAQQYEISLSQVQETEAVLAKKRSDLDQLSAQNQALQQMIAEKDNQYQHFSVQMANMEKNLEQQLELNRQLKETQPDLERKLETALRKENDWKIEISKLNTAIQQEKEEKRQMEHKINQLSDELRQSKNEKPELTETISLLKSELNQLQNQKSAENGDNDENKAHQVQILNLTNELSSVKSELSSIKSEMLKKEKQFELELESSNNNYSKLQVKLEEQQAKNNDLRTKNWKVMEALNAAENKCKLMSSQKTEFDVNKLSREITEKQESAQKQFILRLFPDIHELKNVTSTEDWQVQFGTLIGNYVNTLKKQGHSPSSSPTEVTKLQAEVTRYKTIIDDAEGMLGMLQHQVQNQEITWQKDIASKEAEIENLKKEITKLSALEKKVVTLEKQLAEVTANNQRLNTEAELFRQPPQSAAHQADATATIEKLTEEVNSLREQLRVKQTKNGDINVCLKAQNSCNNSTNGPALIEVPIVRNANICSNLGCQFLYCDGSSCRGE